LSAAPDLHGHAVPMRTFAPGDEVDAVVIGTGASGAPLLARLAQAGLKVVALEAGPFYVPTRDFATDERAQSYLFWNDERLSAGADPIGFGRNNSGCGVGGSTLHFTAYTPRPQPDDFHLRTEFGVGQDWPIGYEDLEPYFDELETFLGVSGPNPYPWGPPRKSSYPLPPLPLNPAARSMQKAYAALSSSYYQEEVGWRAAYANRGFCQAGCSLGAKASMDQTFIPLALHHGAEVRAECFVRGFEQDASRRITGAIYRRTASPNPMRQRCRRVFLCTGAVETPRLLLIMELANSSGQVGRNFMAHVGVQVWGQLEAETRPYQGIPGGLISEDTHRPKDADFTRGYLLQSLGVMPVTYISQYTRATGTWGPVLKDHMAGYNRVIGINVLGECLPSERNYLELSDEKDAQGLPKPRIHFTAGQNERLMRELWALAGAEAVWAYGRST